MKPPTAQARFLLDLITEGQLGGMSRAEMALALTFGALESPHAETEREWFVEQPTALSQFTCLEPPELEEATAALEAKGIIQRKPSAVAGHRDIVLMAPPFRKPFTGMRLADS